MHKSFDLNIRPIAPIVPFITDNENRTLSADKQLMAIAIPILSLFNPMARFMMNGVGLFEFHVAYKAYCQMGKSWDTQKVLLWKTAKVIASFVTPLYIAMSSMETLYAHGEQMRKARSNKEKVTIALWMLHEIVYCGSMVVATPELLVISMIAQAALEAYRTRRDYQNRNYIMALGTLALSVLRLHQVMPHLETLKTKYSPDISLLPPTPPSKPYSARDSDEILAKAQEAKKANPSRFQDLDIVLARLKEIKETDPVKFKEFTALAQRYMELYPCKRCESSSPS